MKGLFPQFDPAASKDFETLWKEATFVFDTNVLLNLYRYQSETRDQLLEVLTKLSDRIWVPHHVALEFQRNRLAVLADQNKRFAQVRSAVNSAQSGLQKGLEELQLDRRHSLIDPEPLTTGFEKLVLAFLSDLDAIQERQQKLTDIDPLKQKIESLFEGRVGEPPSDQKRIDDHYK